MGLPGLDKPLRLHSSRNYECSLKTAEECQYQQGFWRFWYEADHRYGLSTIYFFIAVVGVFTLAHWYRLSAGSGPAGGLYRTLRSTARWLAYKGFRLNKVDYNSPSAGVLFLGAAGFIFFTALTLGPKPYYWPTNDHWGHSPPLATRSGWMALACLPFVLATSSKVNLITTLTGIGHERLQVFHRWISYAMFVLALLHTFPFIVFNQEMGTTGTLWYGSIFYWTGTAALICQAWLTFGSLRALRAIGYESFKILHFFAAALFIVMFFLHCDAELTSWDYFIATAAVYVPTFLYSVIRTYVQYGFLQANLSATENGFVRVSIPIDAYWRPGQHFFLRFASSGFGVHAFTAHPFTVCSLPDPKSKTSELVFYIRARNGFTGRLHRSVLDGATADVRILLDGPYGGIEPSELAENGSHLIIAGGSGAGWSLPLIQRCLQFSHASRPRLDSEDKEPSVQHVRSLRVILATREAASYEWYHDEIEKIRARFNSSQHSVAPTSVEVFFTGNGTPPSAVIDDAEKALADDSSSSSVSPKNAKIRVDPPQTGRPHLASIIAAEAEHASAQGLHVYACGPASMQHDIREACADAQFKTAGRGGGVYMHLEHFDWA